jgi:hypothetical protein
VTFFLNFVTVMYCGTDKASNRLSYELDDLGLVRIENILLAITSRPDPGPTQPLIQLAQEALSHKAKQLGCENGVEIKNAWSYGPTSTPPYILRCGALLSTVTLPIKNTLSSDIWERLYHIKT